ncbi:MAG: aspartate aminotransferase family protein [Saprospiraceae bacterium]|nr:aspartate aminotransferase family protein [Saprospiraceae bacterium]
MLIRRQFLELISQTSEIPQGFQISRAQGCYLFDKKGESYLDLISGFGVSNIGHGVPEVLAAIRHQSQNYLHSNVYGEHIQETQVKLAERLADLLPPDFNSFYFLNSGSEAVDAAIKLSRLATGRPEIVVCRNAYHGSTIGAESLRSDEAHRNHFLPLIPGIRFIDFGNLDDLDQINHRTAAVLTEFIQAEAGVREASALYWQALRNRCSGCGSLLVFDEIQTGMGRTGKLFAFMHSKIKPDILLSGKALGAGMPLSAVISNRNLMQQLFKKLPLAHISTFGGHPVSCAAGLAGLNFLLSNQLVEKVEELGRCFESLLDRSKWKAIRRAGLFMALDFQSKTELFHAIGQLYRHRILAEGFLFSPCSLRVAPPLCISEKELAEVAEKINNLPS